MIQIIVQAQKASCRKSSGEKITTGMVGKKVSFDFSADWDGLIKTAVFEGSGAAKDVVLTGDAAEIPHECLTVPGGMLRVGVFGTDGTIQTPTVYTDIGQIEQGADPSGEESADPTLPIWAQLQAMMGDLGNLTTTAKNNLVAAINEAAKSGGGGAAADVKMQVAGGYIQYSSDGGKSWVNLIALSELIGPTDETLTKSGKAADAAVVGNRLSALSEEIVTTSESKVAAHNTGTDTHSDIRLLIQGLTDRLNALADSDDTTLDQLSEVVSYIKSNRSLIEAITTSKVSMADIVDNLTTNVSNKPLSAAQGVALKALIDAISVPDTLPNPNALTFTGAVTGSYDGSAPLSVEIPAGGGSMEMELLAELQGDGEATSFSATFDGIEKPGLYLLRFMVKGADAENTGNNLYAKFGGSGIWGNGIRSLSIATVNNQYDIKVHIMLIITDGLGNAYVASGAERNLNDSVEAPDSENKIIDGVVSLYSQNSKPVFSGASVMLWRLL